MESITLRGHHLRPLYKQYIDKVPIEEIRRILIEEMRYDEKHVTRHIEITSKIIEGGRQIIFTDGLDDFCSGCSRHNATCSDSDSKQAWEDRNYLRSYGFKIGKVYSTEEVLKTLRECDGTFMFDDSLRIG